MALSRLHVIDMMSQPFGPAAAAALDAARREAKLSGNLRMEHGLNQTAGYVTLWCGEFDQSGHSFERAIELGASFSPFDGYTAAGYTWLLSLLGRFPEMAPYLERARMDGSVPTLIVALTGAYEASERTASEDVDDVLAELLDVASSSPESQRSVPAMSAKVRSLLRAGGPIEAGSSCWQLLDLTTSARGRGSHWLFSPDYAQSLLTEDRVDELRRWSEAIDVVTVNDGHAHNRAASAFVRACLATATADNDTATSSIADAAALYGAMPCPARSAEVQLVGAELAMRRGDDDSSQAAAHAAREIAAAIGARDLTDKADAIADRATVETRVLTVLFTDVVGSTELLSELGDRAWHHLLERHDAFVRGEVTRFGGHVVNTTGDGFVVSFESPTQALKCAVSLREAMDPLGFGIRVGLHTGECQLVAGDLRGIAVHIAARVCAEGGAGEILVTSTVRDLTLGLSIDYEELGVRELRGVPGSWPLLRLRR
jgi:class 3 adenylate cyclase